MKTPKLPKRRAVAIVADGPSAAVLRHQTLPQELYIIGVNYASIWMPRCDAYMTACPDHRQRFAMNHQRQGVRYFAAVPHEYGSAIGRGSQRGKREKNVTFFEATDGPGMERDITKIATCAPGFPQNSTFAALNLALHLGAERIVIFGHDCTSRPRVSGGVPTGLDRIADLFELYDGDALVKLASPESVCKAFTHTSPDEGIAWALQAR